MVQGPAFRHKILITKSYSQNFSHKILVTKIQSQNFSHKIYSQNFSHRILVTQFQSQTFGKTFVFTKFQSLNISLKIVATKFQSHNFSHTILVTNCSQLYLVTTAFQANYHRYTVIPSQQILHSFLSCLVTCSCCYCHKGRSPEIDRAGIFPEFPHSQSRHSF